MSDMGELVDSVDLLKSTRDNIREFLSCDTLPSWARDSVVELLSRKENGELNNRFFKTSEFGTGGIRGRTIAKILTKACAIMSANSGFICPKDVIVFGEVGLSGEIRSMPLVSQRISEAEKLGFKKAIVPKNSLKNLSYKGNVKVYGADTLSMAIKILRD